MDVPINAEVQCVDGPGGKSTYVVIDPATWQVTHVVVETSTLLRSEHVVPVNLIRQSTPDKIELRSTQAELAALPRFAGPNDRKGEGTQNNAGAGQWVYAPAAAEGEDALPVEFKDLPAGALALRRGAAVEATDGGVGTVADLVVDPVTSHITHVIVHQGTLFNPRRVTIDADQIDHVSDHAIYLKMDRHAVDLLPDVPARQ